MKTSVLRKESVSQAQPWQMLAWLLAAQVLVAFVGRSLAPLGVLIGEDLSLTKAQIGMLPAALFLGQSIVAIPAGFLADRIGSKKLLLILSTCLGASFMLMTMTSIFSVVLVMVALGGLGYGAMHPTSNRGIIYWFAAKKRGTAMGIKQTGVTLGSALAAFLLLPLAGEWGWRPVLFGACLILIVTGFLAYAFYRDPPFQKEVVSANDPNRFLSLIMKMFKHKPLVLISLSAVGLSGSQMILTTYLVLFAYERLGISLFLSGILLVISEVSGSFGRVAWGVISDRLFNGKRLVILMIISLLTAVTSLTVATLAPGTPFWLMVPITIVFGFCISGYNGLWMNAATELVPREQSGIASGFSLMVGSWGVIFGPPLFGFIVDSTGTFAYGWLFLAAVMLIVIILLFCSMAMIKRREQV
jgi:ACS family hexuronate transporter-like MFS transporter